MQQRNNDVNGLVRAVRDNWKIFVAVMFIVSAFVTLQIRSSEGRNDFQNHLDWDAGQASKLDDLSILVIRHDEHFKRLDKDIEEILTETRNTKRTLQSVEKSIVKIHTIVMNNLARNSDKETGTSP